MAEEKKKLEELMEELVEEMKKAKTPEELEVLKRKAEILEDIIETYEGDKDLEKVAFLVEKLGDAIEEVIGPIKDLLAELYNPERMQVMGKSVAEFYKTLVESGMDKESALELTKEYMESINIGKQLLKAFASFVPMMGPHGQHGRKEGSED
ncbi:hypothetical protein A3L04_03605 [Thermococcus chitonophagus]|uniref:Uncharacterized protein n=1 Tax=Thermococcus chitonophagus TaxID=54262 RepID=A0A170SX01_9EURY|nr:hypothetical protein [Thermococcus chitonophagus]ASJ16230.1 hypothetical protein A3L04_03605 [Thermococcus chitonophagus]CUX78795.1 hypothetical protein CHITON_2016 [Thermococcus chitonophagus]